MVAAICRTHGEMKILPVIETVHIKTAISELSETERRYLIEIRHHELPVRKSWEM